MTSRITCTRKREAVTTVGTCLYFADSDVEAVVEVGDGQTQLALVVALLEELIAHQLAPLLAHLPRPSRVADVSTLQRYLTAQTNKYSYTTS